MKANHKIIDLIENKLSEYEPSVQACQTDDEIDWDKLIYLLMEEHGWTQEGAKVVAAMVRGYGSFI